MSDICTTVAGGNRHTSERVSADLRINDAEINIENTKTTGSKKLKGNEKPSEDDTKSSTEGCVL